VEGAPGGIGIVTEGVPGATCRNVPANYTFSGSTVARGGRVWSGIVRVGMRDAGGFRSVVPSDASSCALRGRLVAGTAALHDELERLPLMVAMAEGRAGPDDYLRWLRLLWEVHAAYEPRLRSWVDDAWGDERLVKSGWLCRDLAALGHPPPAASPLDMTRWPAVTRPGDAWGVQYVLEGSTLGALVIRERFGDAGHPFSHARRFLDA